MPLPARRRLQLACEDYVHLYLQGQWRIDYSQLTRELQVLENEMHQLLAEIAEEGNNAAQDNPQT